MDLVNVRYFILFAALSLAGMVAYSIDWGTASWANNSGDFLGMGAMMCTALAMLIANNMSKRKA